MRCAAAAACAAVLVNAEGVHARRAMPTSCSTADCQLCSMTTCKARRLPLPSSLAQAILSDTYPVQVQRRAAAAQPVAAAEEPGGQDAAPGRARLHAAALGPLHRGPHSPAQAAGHHLQRIGAQQLSWLLLLPPASAQSWRVRVLQVEILEASKLVYVALIQSKVLLRLGPGSWSPSALSKRQPPVEGTWKQELAGPGFVVWTLA